MKKYGIIGILFFIVLLVAGCVMVPSDEEIIKGSVLETEIFGNNLDDEGMNNEELKINNEDGEEQNIVENDKTLEESEISENDENLNSNVDFKVVE